MTRRREPKSEQEIAIDKMIQVLKSHDIEMSVLGCGCCDTPWVGFRYKGEIIINKGDVDMAGNCNFTTEEE
jgi:hypothetical protein